MTILKPRSSNILVTDSDPLPQSISPSLINLRQELSQQQIISKPRGVKTNIQFYQEMSYEQACFGLLNIFTNNYDKACNDISIISDYLSVRDLRTLVRVLNLCEISDLFNHRKPVLCLMIQSFLNQPLMKDLYTDVILTKPSQLYPDNTYTIDNFIYNKNDELNVSKNIELNSNTKDESSTIIKVHHFSKIDGKSSKTFSSNPIPQHIQFQKCELLIKSAESPFVIDPIDNFTYSKSDVEKLKQTVTTLSNRLTEMERNVSALETKISEIENKI
ncbi:hypothetical protein TVAG_041630 [Trichomonas vaginalis G3]|uniref:Uncharacterized protein n=1 Tax=Trichomonas vaginalis (strain ATCC PRA-98 / G3) TaxID=412133 RepID=A2FEV7_TRIV3|nr:hypothetical protein TVAGG3_0702670 [Trichomonas vaginalis G3]EAX96561.1 hypothetical protein TVAG_041630 [Trichomonas vaginalis G3]KAI5509340.1 hypothetical protein TVAGG3_0702670 [Trichomonas vaginalis G3]|eukprot:XP_001309491.1 hypothetical protein [Trichomonas vaginalis G3]